MAESEFGKTCNVCRESIPHTTVQPPPAWRVNTKQMEGCGDVVWGNLNTNLVSLKYRRLSEYCYRPCADHFMATIDPFSNAQ